MKLWQALQDQHDALSTVHGTLVCALGSQARNEAWQRRALLAVHQSWHVYITGVQVCLTETPESL